MTSPTTYAYFSGSTTTYTTSPSLGSVPYTVPIPVIDYSSRDYETVLQDLITRIPFYLPEWTSQNPSDFGIVLLQLYAYTVDLLGYYLDRLAGEAFIQTATQPTSILNLAAMLNYTPSLSIGASVQLQITISSSLIGGSVTIPAGTIFETPASTLSAQPAIPFLTTDDVTIAPGGTALVGAVQGVAFSDELIGVSDGTVNQAYPLANSPVSAYSYSVFVELDPSIGPQQWTYMTSLLGAAQFDLAYTSFVDQNGVFYVIFGDGVNGYIPPLGATITCNYQINVGVSGDVGANTITQPVSAVMGLSSVTNPAPASGGATAETVGQVRVNAPASLRSLYRAITVDDFQSLAVQVAGVQWASSVIVTYQLVDLYICPAGLFPVQPSQTLINAVLNYLTPLALAGTTITVLGPTYVGIEIAIQVHAYANYSNSEVQAVVVAALANLLAMTNTGFGYRVTLGVIYQVVLALPGVNWAVITNLHREILVTLTSPIPNGTTITQLLVTPLPHDIEANDVLQIASTDATPHMQPLIVLSNVVAGSTTIPILTSGTPSVAGALYAIGSTVADLSGPDDCLTLDNEIPIVGTGAQQLIGISQTPTPLYVTVTGGLIGS
jgi:hypothetical protein